MTVAATRVLVGLGLGAIVAAGIAVAPASGASGSAAVRTAKRPVTLSTHGIGSFTPASADPRLAAVLARANLAANGFRFTPSETRGGGRAVTVAVRARSSRTGDAERLASATVPAVSLTPLAYNLGVAVGWKRFALSGDVTKVDLAGSPGSREGADLALSYSGQRISGRVKAAAERPLVGTGTPVLPGDAQSYSLDVGGSYSLSHNLDVTAGVRYRSDQNRLQRLEDTRRDSQAVYVGTAFRF